MSYLTRTNAGALALTFASIILLSGLWCIYLSPTMPQHISKLFRQEDTILGAESSATYDVEVQEQDKLTIQIHNVWLENYTTYSTDGIVMEPLPRVHIYLRDPLDLVIWAEEYVSHSWFSMDLASGHYTLEIVNVHDDADIRVFFTISVSGNVDYRPLQPFGSWLILVSWPVFALGFWASGVLSKIPFDMRYLGEEKQKERGKKEMRRSVGGLNKKMTLAFLALLMTGSVIALSRIQPAPSSKEAVVSPNGISISSDALLIKLDVPELTKQAYTILVGTVEDARTLVVGTVISRAGPLPYIVTDYTVRVERYLKNSLGQESVVVRNRGGRIGNVTVWCSDQAPLTVAERVLLFLVKGVEDGVEMEYFVVLGGFQGKYAIIVDTALCKDTDGPKEWSEPLRTLLEKLEANLRES